MTNTMEWVAARGVAAERARRGWSQTKLGDRLGWHQSRVSAVERGQRRLTLDHVVALCRVLGVPLSTLVQGGDPADLRALGLSSP